MAVRDPHAFWDLFAAVTRAVRGVAAEAYAELELGTAQAKILRHVGLNSHISQADLARATDTAPTLTGRAIEPLVERGWVRRRRNKDDRRQYVLELTAAGQRTRSQVEDARERVIARVGAALDARDLEDFERIASKVLAVLAREVDPSPPPAP